MKNIIISTILAAFCLTATAQMTEDSTNNITQTATQSDNQIAKQTDNQSLTPIEDLLARAEQSFLDGQYPMAVANYMSVIEKGEHSSAIYYNLGCAYFQQNQIGKAIINFARAKALNPGDVDIQYNMELALAKTKDKIEPTEKFIIARWLESLSTTQSSSQWTVTSLILLLITAAAVVLWLITQRLSLRKLGFFVGLFAAVALLLSIICGTQALDREDSTASAVIMNNAVSVKSSPSEGGKDIFILHEGTEVDILQSLDTWSEIRLKDGNRGWLQTSAIEQLWNNN